MQANSVAQSHGWGNFLTKDVQPFSLTTLCSSYALRLSLCFANWTGSEGNGFCHRDTGLSHFVWPGSLKPSLPMQESRQAVLDVVGIYKAQGINLGIKAQCSRDASSPARRLLQGSGFAEGVPLPHEPASVFLGGHQVSIIHSCHLQHSSSHL